MELVISHISTDFDAASSMVAAAKLHPGAQLGLSGSLNRNVREFFRFYLRDVRFLRARDIDLDGIERLIVVDTQDISRLGRFSSAAARPGMRKIFYDHHPPVPELARDPASELVIRNLGSTATVVVRQLLARRIPISPTEATLFCTGIYEDTGCLLFSSTTRTDVKTVYDLMRLGADLTITASYIGRGLNEEQRGLLADLRAGLSMHSVHGHTIGIACASRADYVEDVDVVVGKLREIEDLRIVFVAAGLGRHTHVIGRSRSDEVPVGRVLARPGGGGGHAGAGRGVVHDRRPADVVPQLLAALDEIVEPLIVARRIMSSPVKTIPSTATISDAWAVMSGFGYGGLPVVERGRLVGLVLRADMEKAERHGLGPIKVAGYMTRDPAATAPDATVLDVQRMMISGNLTHVPVVETGNLVGIVTARDVMRHLHRRLERTGRVDAEPVATAPADASEAMERLLGPGPMELLRAIGEVGDGLAMGCYLIGGSVRDLLLERSPGSDLDLAVEQDAHAVARTFHGRVGGKLVLHDHYRSATVTVGDTRVDFVTTRREYYEFPAARPRVDTQDVKLDLYRRDFTINAMAICLNRGRSGQLVDYYGGYRDLDGRRIRVLHALSFVEDPTRIFRAFRFAARLGFDLEPRTRGFLDEALASGMLERLSPEVLFEELYACARERPAATVFEKLAAAGAVRRLAGGVDLPPERLAAVRAAERVVNDHEAAAGKLKDRAYAFFLALFLADPAIAAAIRERVFVPQRYLRWAESLAADSAAIAAAAPAQLRPLVAAHFAPARALGLAALAPEVEGSVLGALRELRRAP
jgi:tRNA nucleotidyltransferase (CCA-adding enzyme)